MALTLVLHLGLAWVDLYAWSCSKLPGLDKEGRISRVGIVDICQVNVFRDLVSSRMSEFSGTASLCKAKAKHRYTSVHQTDDDNGKQFQRLSIKLRP